MLHLKNKDYSLPEILFNSTVFGFALFFCPNSFQLITPYWNTEDCYGDDFEDFSIHEISIALFSINI